jgi:hypothetical protein
MLVLNPHALELTMHVMIIKCRSIRTYGALFDMDLIRQGTWPGSRILLSHSTLGVNAGIADL